MKEKFLVVAGNPFRGYTGTQTYTSLRILGKCSTLKQVKAFVDKNYDEIGGLWIVIDLSTGEEVPSSLIWPEDDDLIDGMKPLPKR